MGRGPGVWRPGATEKKKSLEVRSAARSSTSIQGGYGGDQQRMESMTKSKKQADGLDRDLDSLQSLDR